MSSFANQVILITGAAGFLGRNVLLAVPRYWDVVALYRPGNTDFLAFLEANEKVVRRT